MVAETIEPPRTKIITARLYPAVFFVLNEQECIVMHTTFLHILQHTAADKDMVETSPFTPIFVRCLGAMAARGFS